MKRRSAGDDDDDDGGERETKRFVRDEKDEEKEPMVPPREKWRQWRITEPLADDEMNEHCYNEMVVDVPYLERCARLLDERTRLTLAFAWVQHHGFASHHIQHFDHFMETLIPKILHENTDVVVPWEPTNECHVIRFENVRIMHAGFKESNAMSRTLVTQEGRVRNLTPSCPVLVNLRHQVYRMDGIVREKFANFRLTWPEDRLIYDHLGHEMLVCEIPVMAGSKFSIRHKAPFLSGDCPYDPEGYIMINSNEKVLIPQEENRFNHPFVYKCKAGGKWAYMLEARCLGPKFRSSSNLHLYISLPGKESGHSVVVRVPYFNCEFPVLAMFRLLGFGMQKGVEQIVQMVLDHRPMRRASDSDQPDPELERMVRDIFSNPMCCPDQPIQLHEWMARLGNKKAPRGGKMRVVDNMLMSEFFPHLGLDKTQRTFNRKADYLAYCLCLLCVVALGRRPCDDRHHLSNRRAATVQILLARQVRFLFRESHNLLQKTLRRNLTEKKPIILENLLSHKRMTGSLKYALATGNWGSRRNASPITGVVQARNVTGISGVYASTRRINNHVSQANKFAPDRQLHPSHWGRHCPLDTPEGQPCGNVRNLAMGCIVRVGADPELVHEWLCQLADADPHTPKLKPPLPVHNARPRDVVFTPGNGDDEEDDEEEEVLVDDTVNSQTDQWEPRRGLFILGTDWYREYADERWRERRRLTAVHLNGVPIGYSSQPRRLVRLIYRSKRAQWGWPIDLSVLYQPCSRLIALHCDPGAYGRPLMRVGEIWRLERLLAEHLPGYWEGLNAPKMTDQQASRLILDCLRLGVMEAPSTDEENTYRIAVHPQHLYDHQRDELLRLFPEQRDDLVNPIPPERTLRAETRWPSHLQPYTHVELHPLLYMGVCGNLIPFADMNQVPRDMYFCAHSKQTPSATFLSVHHRFDNLLYGMWYSARPLVRTAFEKYFPLGQMPSGMNVLTAIGTLDGYNIEDSIYWNSGADDLGYMRCEMTKKVSEEEKADTNDRHVLEKPDPQTCHGMRQANADKLDPKTGLAPPGTTVVKGDLLIGKTITTEEIPVHSHHGGQGLLKRQVPIEDQIDPPKDKPPKFISRDASHINNSREEGKIEKTIVTRNPLNCKVHKLFVRTCRRMAIGDKVSSRHGQKGTIGMTNRPEDMPFTGNGLTPLVLINPSSYPSRMTAGMLMESDLSGLAVKLGCEIDATCFRRTPDDARLIREMRRSHGLSPNGTTVMYHPYTGEMIRNRITMGLVYYVRLKHFIEDKWGGRSQGPRQVLTRQPIEGRTREGGLRFGEMEVGCVICSGASHLLLERLLHSSDPAPAYVCKRCGLLAEAPAENVSSSMVRATKPYCRNCRSGDQVILITLPYSWIQLNNELRAYNIIIPLRFAEFSDPQDRPGEDDDFGGSSDD